MDFETYLGTEPTPVTEECPDSPLYRCYDGNATEVEVLEFLGALVKMTKPKMIVETGTYLGYGTGHLAQGAVGFECQIHTAEVTHELVESAKANLKRWGFSGVHFHEMEGKAMIQSIEGSIDFAFIDSNLNGARVEEFLGVIPKLSKRGVVAIHDTSAIHGGPWVYMEIANQHGLSSMQFQTPRGLTLFKWAVAR